MRIIRQKLFNEENDNQAKPGKALVAAGGLGIAGSLGYGAYKARNISDELEKGINDRIKSENDRLVKLHENAVGKIKHRMTEAHEDLSRNCKRTLKKKAQDIGDDIIDIRHDFPKERQSAKVLEKRNEFKAFRNKMQERLSEAVADVDNIYYKRMADTTKEHQAELDKVAGRVRKNVNEEKMAGILKSSIKPGIAAGLSAAALGTGLYLNHRAKKNQQN